MSAILKTLVSSISACYIQLTIVLQEGAVAVNITVKELLGSRLIFPSGSIVKYLLDGVDVPFPLIKQTE